MYITGFIVPATAIEEIVPPVELEIVTPFIVTSPFWISTLWTVFTPSTSVIWFGSLIVTPRFPVLASTCCPPMFTVTLLFPPTSPEPPLIKVPFSWVKLPPANILAFPFAI